MATITINGQNFSVQGVNVSITNGNVTVDGTVRRSFTSYVAHDC